MGLNVAVVVPEGIVLSSDSLAFLRQDDEGFVATSTRTFAIWDKFLVSFVGNGFINGKPYGYYIQDIEYTRHSDQIASAKEVAHFINTYFQKSQNESDDPLTVYVAGSTIDDAGPHHELYLIDRGKITNLNQTNGKNDVYNYHVIGRSLWINKLVLPTQFIDEHTNMQESFNAATIDFSKYSLDDAEKFAQFLISTTVEMDNFIQTRASANLDITSGVVTMYGAKIKL